MTPTRKTRYSNIMGFEQRLRDYIFEKCTHTERPIVYPLVCGTCAGIVFSIMESERNRETVASLERILDNHDQQVTNAYWSGVAEGNLTRLVKE